MSDYRRATDRIDGRIIAECPECEQSWECVIKLSKRSIKDRLTDEFRECTNCGAEMDMISQETPSEVLE